MTVWSGRALKSYTETEGEILCGVPELLLVSRRVSSGKAREYEDEKPRSGFPSPSCCRYCEHGAVSTLPASTRNAGMFAVDALDGSLDVVVDGEEELPDSSIVPVNSTFL